jgi:uncharacterized protein YchJ
MPNEAFDPAVDHLAVNEFDDDDPNAEISMEELMQKMSGGVPFGSWAQPIRRDKPKVRRNEPCPCGSGKKFKKCCEARA